MYKDREEIMVFIAFLEIGICCSQTTIAKFYHSINLYKYHFIIHVSVFSLELHCHYCFLNIVSQFFNLRQTKAVTSTAPTTAPIIVVRDTELWSMPVAETGSVCLIVLCCSEMK